MPVNEDRDSSRATARCMEGDIKSRRYEVTLSDREGGVWGEVKHFIAFDARVEQGGCLVLHGFDGIVAAFGPDAWQAVSWDMEGIV